MEILHMDYLRYEIQKKYKEKERRWAAFNLNGGQRLGSGGRKRSNQP